MTNTETFLIDAVIRDAEEKFREALEHYHQVTMEFQERGREFTEQRLCTMEEVISACFQMNLKRASVEASRLRLKLLGAEESLLEIELAYKRRHRMEAAPGERINDLGNLEDAESELRESDMRFREAEASYSQLQQLFEVGRIGPGDMLLVIRELAEARAEMIIAHARVSLIKGVRDEAISDLLPDPTDNTPPM